MAGQHRKRYVTVTLKLIGALAASTIALIFAPTAHADDQSYMNDLQQNHIGTGPLTDPVGVGHFVCVQIRGGMSADSVGRMTWGPGLDFPGVVGAAQRDLCPDTLPR